MLVVGVLYLLWGDVSPWLVQAVVVSPVRLVKGRDFDFPNRRLRPVGRDQLSLVVTVDRFSSCVVVGIADGTD